MEDQNTNGSKRVRNLDAVLAVAMLALAVVLGRTAVVQLGSGKIFSGCISALGTVLFLVVALIMGHDLRKRLRRGKPHEEETDHGSD